MPSPDGKYVAKLTDKYNHPSGQTAILILDNQDNLLWTIPYQGGEPTGDPHPGLGIYQWTQDSSALYFFYGWGSDGGGPTLFDALDLQKINIQTGAIRRVLPGTGLMAFAFSPDQRTIAFARAQDIPRRLIIRDLVTGAEQSISVDFESQDNGTQVGWIDWSPNGEHLLFHADENDNFRVIVLDIKTMTQTVLLEYLFPKYSFQSWTTDENLRFSVHVNDNYTVVNIVNIDLGTGSQSIVGTRTPIP